MNGLEIRWFETNNGNRFVYEADEMTGAVVGEGYYVDPEGNLLRSTEKDKRKRGPRRDSAMKERYWAMETFGDNFKEEIVSYGPLVEKLSNLFDSRIPKQRTFGAPKEKESHFAALAGLRDKMGK